MKLLVCTIKSFTCVTAKSFTFVTESVAGNEIDVQTTHCRLFNKINFKFFITFIIQVHAEQKKKKNGTKETAGYSENSTIYYMHK